MTKKTIFISFDGKEFLTEEECRMYEMSMADTEGVLSALKKINNICKYSICRECKFSYPDGSCALTSDVPEDWDLEEFQLRLGDENEI